MKNGKSAVFAVKFVKRKDEMSWEILIIEKFPRNGKYIV